MKNFTVYNLNKTALRTGMCSACEFFLQAGDGEFVMQGTANDITQKIEFDGLDDEGQPINPRVVNKTPEEIKAEKPPVPPVIPFEKQTAHISNEQWQDVLSRLDKLKNNSSE